MTSMTKEILKSYIPTMIGHLIVAVGFIIGAAYAIGKLEAKMDNRITAVEIADITHHETAMTAITQAVSERTLLLRPVYDHMDRENTNDKALSDSMTKIATELTALRVGQENLNRRIDEMRQEMKR